MPYKVNKDDVQICNYCDCGEEISAEDTMCRECWEESPEGCEFLDRINDEFYFPIEEEEDYE